MRCEIILVTLSTRFSVWLHLLSTRRIKIFSHSFSFYLLLCSFIYILSVTNMNTTSFVTFYLFFIFLFIIFFSFHLSLSYFPPVSLPPIILSTTTTNTLFFLHFPQRSLLLELLHWPKSSWKKTEDELPRVFSKMLKKYLSKEVSTSFQFHHTEYRVFWKECSQNIYSFFGKWLILIYPRY